MRPVLIQVVAVTTATILGVQIVAAITAPQLQYPAAANLAAANTNILQQAVQWVENLFRAPTPANEKQTASAAVASKAIPPRAPANPAASPRVLAAATSVPTPVAALPTYITKAQLEARLQQFRNSLPLAVFSPLITPAAPSEYVTQADLASQIAQLQNNFGRTIYGASYPTPAPNYAGGGITTSIALATRIDKLSGTSLSNVTVDGVSGLSDSDIPNDITASNYLPITGGSITGALTIPYLLATSSTASSFTGNVGIGTTTPFAKLSIHANNGDTNTALFTIASSTASATTTLFTVLNNGKVGIALNDARPAGTSLDVGGTIRSGGANNGGSGVLNLVRRNSGLQWEGFNLGYINFQGTTDNYSSVYTAASIISRSDGDGSAFWGDSSPGSLAFLTTMPGAAHASAARVWITSRGLVGVGNFDDGQDANGVSQFPQHQLDVKISPEATAKTAAFSTLNLANTATSTANSIIKSGISISSTGSWTGANASNIGVYVSSVTGGTNNYDAIFNGGGNVGIGQTSPAYKFDVTGAGHFTTFVDAANFIATSSATASIFNGGFLSLASSTIGNGTQAGGLTISGGATTTGNAFFAGNVGIGTAAPTDKLEIAAANSQVRLTDTDDSHFGQISYSSGLFALRANSTSADHFFLTEGGKIGIGTSNPSGTLHISTSTADQLYLQRTGSFTGKYRLGIAGANNNFYIYDDAQSQTRLVINGSGNVGIGTTTPYTRLTVWGPDAAAGTAAFLVANSASTTEFVVYDDGSATLAGTLTQNSDVRLKANVQSLDASSTLGLIAQLDPVIFHWADPAKSLTPQLGFIAQDVQKIFPQLVSTTSPTAQTPDGTLGLNYIGFIAPIVEAIKALMAELHDLEATVAGFADIFTTKELTFSRATGDDLTAKKLHTQELCVSDDPGDQNPVCVTKTQLAALLSQSAAAGFANPLPASPTPSLANPTPATTPATDPSRLANPTPAPSEPQDTEPPVITINGNNPAELNVGDVYNDLGATVMDNVDHNLGIHTFVGTTPIDQAVIDTSTPATYHINYVATDTAGNTATSTRTVIIESPSIIPDGTSVDAATTTLPAFAQ